MISPFKCIVFLSLTVVVFSAPRVKLTTDKHTYLPYEPVYLKIQLMNHEDPAYTIHQLEFAKNRLKITPPEGEPYFYSAPILACNITPSKEPSLKVVFGTLIASGETLVTAKPGLYTLELDSEQSSMASFNVIPARSPEDVRAVELIEKDPYSFAQFIYLEGGEHLRKGLEVSKTLAAGRSQYSGLAKSILALNYSQSFLGFGLPGGKARSKDMREVEKHFPVEMDGVPEYIQITMASMIRRSFGHGEIPATMQAGFQKIKRDLESKGEGMKSFSMQIRD